jgi:hypothetical protein
MYYRVGLTGAASLSSGSVHVGHGRAQRDSFLCFSSIWDMMIIFSVFFTGIKGILVSRRDYKAIMF